MIFVFVFFFCVFVTALVWFFYCWAQLRPCFPVKVRELHVHEDTRSDLAELWSSADDHFRDPDHARYVDLAYAAARAQAREDPAGKSGTARVNGVLVVWELKSGAYLCWRLDGRPTGAWAGWGIKRTIDRRAQQARNQEQVAKILDQGTRPLLKP